jgi:hypothetical protein
MTLNPRAQSAILAVSFAILAALYAGAWFAPAVAGDHASGMNLVTAKALAAGHGYVLDNLPEPVPETGVPPVFPALLALFTLVSTQPQWLKLLPLLCTLGWFALTRRLLLKMGASRGGSLLLIGLTAASPTVVFLSTNLFAESLFALLITVAIWALLAEKPVVAGLLAGLATLTLTAGAALIAACIVTLAVRRRFRSALIFTGIAMLMVAPWFGWSLAHVSRHVGLNNTGRAATNILLALPPNEKLVVAVRNVISLFESPIELLTGMGSAYTASLTALFAIWCFRVRRQLLPDLFVAFYGIALMLIIGPPRQMVAPLLPLVLWMAWRAISLVRRREAIAALILIVAGAAIYADAIRVPALFNSGMFPATEHAANNWRELRKMFGFIAANSSPGSVLLANSDGALYVNTGRKTIRGFTPDGFSLYYSEKKSTVTPDQISTAIQETQVNYVVLTPDRDAEESPSFHNAVEALERGGVLRPVEVPGLDPEYRLLHVMSSGN